MKRDDGNEPYSAAEYDDAIILTIEGGVLQNVDYPEGCKYRIVVKDYDCEEDAPGDPDGWPVKVDSAGDEYYELER